MTQAAEAAAARAVFDKAAAAADAAWDAVQEVVGRGRQLSLADDAAHRSAQAWCSTNGQFLDEAFPAAASSLCHNEQQGGVPTAWREAVWRRPAEVAALAAPGSSVAPVAQLFSDTAKPTDVAAGEIGDGYFLAALAALAERPGSVEALFVPAKALPGAYCVRLCVGGHFREILVDDTLPCSPETVGDVATRGGPLFSRARGPELWVSIVEKAFAKAASSYQAMAAGQPGECLTTLTGAPCAYLPAADPALWERVFEAASRDFAAAKAWPVLAVLPQPAPYPLAEISLPHGTALSVIDARQVAQPGTPPLQLLRLRYATAPPGWAWAGEFGPGGSGWTPALQAALGDVGASEDASAFWVSVAEFAHRFAGVHVCRASPATRHVSEAVTLAPRHTAALLLTILGDAPVSLDLTAHAPEVAPGGAHVGLRLTVLQAYSCEILAHRPLAAAREVSVEARHLLPGRYWLLLETDWDGTPRPGTLSGGLPWASPRAALASSHCLPRRRTCQVSTPLHYARLHCATCATRHAPQRGPPLATTSPSQRWPSTLGR